MRCLDVEVWRHAGQLLDEVIEQVAVPFGVNARVEHIRGVPPVVNTDTETTMIENAARAELGEDSIVLVEQSMGGEDFAWMLQEVPGSMFRLGTRALKTRHMICIRGITTPMSALSAWACG